MIIDAKNSIVGRLASKVAKKAILGEEIIILNSEQAVISGPKEVILKKYKAQANRGEPFHGPFMPKTPHLLLKRIIRGMLPYKFGKGRTAFKRIKCYVGIPEVFKNSKIETIEEANISRLQILKYTTLKELCNMIKHKNENY